MKNNFAPERLDQRGVHTWKLFENNLEFLIKCLCACVCVHVWAQVGCWKFIKYFGDSRKASNPQPTKSCSIWLPGIWSSKLCSKFDRVSWPCWVILVRLRVLEFVVIWWMKKICQFIHCFLRVILCTENKRRKGMLHHKWFITFARHLTFIFKFNLH